MGVKIHTSTTSDGSMKSLHAADARAIAAVRAVFLRRHDIAPGDTSLVRLVYEGDDYRRYKTLTDEHRGDGIVRASTVTADALVVTEPGHALFLPLADCVGAVLYSQTDQIMMMTHLGRHNLEQSGGAESVRYLQQYHGVRPSDLSVWLSPAAGAGNYPLFAFAGRGLHDVATEQLIAAGVHAAAIDGLFVDTTTSSAYFSHSEYLKGNRVSNGRFAIAAVMTA